MFFFVDESIKEPSYFCMGCVAIKEDDFSSIQSSIYTLKRKIGLSEDSRIKYSLGDNDKVEKEQKVILRHKYGKSWIYPYRKEIADVISDINVYFVSTLHQDFRSLKSGYVSFAFFKQAFSWLLQDLIYPLAFYKSRDELNYVILDRPPSQFTDYEIHQLYKEALGSSKKKIFHDNLLFSNDKYNTYLQISDFFCGLMVDVLKACEKKEESHPCLNLLKTVSAKLFPLNGGDVEVGCKHFAITMKDFIPFFNKSIKKPSMQYSSWVP
ncbi:DUF3800 domain-containing protein [Candidatus Margulisiibacteriota bacterium]